MISDIDFLKVANRVFDSYQDFAPCLLRECKDEDLVEEVFEFMIRNPRCSTDDIEFYLIGLQRNAGLSANSQPELALA